MRTLAFTGATDWLLALLPETILALGALAILMVDAFARREPEAPEDAAAAAPDGTNRPAPDGAAPPAREGSGALGWRGAGIAAVAFTILAGLANGWLLGVESGAEPAAAVALDGFRVAANFVVLGATLLGILFAFDYLARERLRAGEFHSLLLLASVGMMVLVAARDLILVFLGLELMSVAVYVLTAYDRRRARSSEAGLKYFLIGAFASAFLLYGIALLYGAVGSTHLGRVAETVAAAAAGEDLLLLAGLGLLLVGFAFKVAAVPFHMWTPDAYEGAPAPVTGYMAAGVKAAAFAALLRIVVVDLAPAASAWQAILWWLAVLTMVVPNLIALVQDDVKRMLAYSSVAHAGYVLVGVVAGSALGMAAALFYLAVYALMTLGAFAVAAHVAGKGERRGKLDDYRGLGWSRPFLAVAMLIFLLSLAGFPPTGGFVAKLFLLRAAVESGFAVLAVVLVVTSLVSYYYYFRVAWKMYFDEAPAEAPERERPAAVAPGGAFRLAAGVCALGVLAGGLAPGPAIDRVERAGASLLAEGPEPAAAPAARADDAPAGPAARAGAAAAAVPDGGEAEAGGSR